MLLIAIVLSGIFSFNTTAHAGDSISLIPKEWLQTPISVAQAEAAHPGITDDRVKRFPDAAKPFGFNNANWEALKAEMQPGDELWTYSSSPESWRQLAGRSGIALVRNGTPIKILPGLMN
jgi:hypothetical protein